MNYVRALLFVLLSLQLVFIGCNREESGPTAVVPVAGYQYKAYDLDGDVVATGTLNLSFEGAAITGQRDIKGAGLEAGSGAITGRVQSDNTIQIELNPGSAALVILEGKLEEICSLEIDCLIRATRLRRLRSATLKLVRLVSGSDEVVISYS